MTEEQLARLERLHAAATGGRWHGDDCGVVVYVDDLGRPLDVDEADAAARYYKVVATVLPPLGTEERTENGPLIAAVRNDLPALIAEIRKLRAAIRAHRDQKADDRCVEDDDRLYEALGDGVPCDRRVGCKEAMLRNCERFIDRRTEGGGWPTYAELEALVAAYREKEKETACPSS